MCRECVVIHTYIIMFLYVVSAKFNWQVYLQIEAINHQHIDTLVHG